MKKDHAVEFILELDDTRYCIDEHLKLWVKFEVKKSKVTEYRPHGIKYSFTLHNSANKRVMGFDNSHAIKFDGKGNITPLLSYDHYHESSGKCKPYYYKNAAALVQDFWREVEKIVKKLKEDCKYVS